MTLTLDDRYGTTKVGGWHYVTDIMEAAHNDLPHNDPMRYVLTEPGGYATRIEAETAALRLQDEADSRHSIHRLVRQHPRLVQMMQEAKADDREHRALLDRGRIDEANRVMDRIEERARRLQKRLRSDDPPAHEILGAMLRDRPVRKLLDGHS